MQIKHTHTYSTYICTEISRDNSKCLFWVYERSGQTPSGLLPLRAPCSLAGWKSPVLRGWTETERGFFVLCNYAHCVSPLPQLELRATLKSSTCSRGAGWCCSDSRHFIVVLLRNQSTSLQSVQLFDTIPKIKPHHPCFIILALASCSLWLGLLIQRNMVLYLYDPSIHPFIVYTASRVVRGAGADPSRHWGTARTGRQRIAGRIYMNEFFIILYFYVHYYVFLDMSSRGKTWACPAFHEVGGGSGSFKLMLNFCTHSYLVNYGHLGWLSRLRNKHLGVIN